MISSMIGVIMVVVGSIVVDGSDIAAATVAAAVAAAVIVMMMIGYTTTTIIVITITTIIWLQMKQRPHTHTTKSPSECFFICLRLSIFTQFFRPFSKFCLGMMKHVKGFYRARRCKWNRRVR